MQPDRALQLPELEATGYDREGLLDALSNRTELPTTEVAAATLYPDAIAPEVVSLLERARSEDLDPPSGRLLFRGLYILGGRRVSAAYRPLIGFLRGPRERVDALLGDAVTATLPKILAGLFDGDAEPLLALIADLEVDEFVREGALKAFAFLVFDRKIERPFACDYLLRFERESTAPKGDMIWHGWMTAVALLGFDELSDRVHAAFVDRRIPWDVAHESDYREILAAALQRPDDAQRFADEQLGYIEDILTELGGWFFDDNEASDPAGPDALPYWPEPDARLPAHNPWRGVGRNDPCPCGSGKKFKKCCLP